MKKKMYCFQYSFHGIHLIFDQMQFQTIFLVQFYNLNKYFF